MVKMLLFSLLLGLLACALSSCSSQTGWGIAFNVHPITSVSETKELNSNDLMLAKAKKRGL